MTIFYSVDTNKKVISTSYDSSTTGWKLWRWVRLNMIFMIRDIYINSNLNPHTEFTSSSRSTKFKDICPWNFTQMIRKIIPLSNRIVISYVMRQGILFWVWWKFNGNWDNNIIWISHWRESHCRTNTSIRRKKQIQNNRTVTVTVRYPSRKVNHLSKVIWDWHIITEFTRFISSTRIG